MEDRVIRSARVIGAIALVLLGIWLALAWNAPVERTQGIVQKILYAHVPCWLPAYLGFILTAVGGIGFLATRDERWDRFAFSAAEVGVFFCTLGLLTGPIWAKQAWGHWWVWDLRLTSALVLWFIYVAYLFLREFAVGSDAARTLASVYGIVGTAMIPFVYYSVDIAGGATLHPENPARHGMPAAMGWALIVGLTAFSVLFAYFVARRLDVARLEAQVEQRESPA